ncbi:MAG: DUF2066 domain-containing protein [Gammaproteobacteria bacterium]|nr:DUF2066 domain-containing protein [Gammaproteobacteria bacterium]NND58708.1 DUF2066 domain-containing protein [Gammaproteobacteria bacterium]
MLFLAAPGTVSGFEIVPEVQAMQQIISRLWPQIAVCLVLLWPAQPALAVVVPDLYSATATAIDRSQEERVEAFRNALATVLVKVSGDRQVTSNPATVDLLDNAQGYLQQYRYTESGDIWAAFDGESLERAMRNIGLPVWGRDRPAVLLWLAVDWGGGRRGIVTADQDTQLRASIQRVADSRGMPIVFPLFDSEDRDLMSFSDLWGGFSEKIDAASARYAPGAVLVGRASRGSGSRLFVRWQLDFGGIRESWEGGLSPGLHQAASLLAQRFATRAGSSSASTVLAVSGIDSFADYAEVSAYLEKLSVVSAISVQQVAADTVLFGVQLQGDPAQLFRILDLNATVVPYEPELDSRLADGAVYYRFAR